ncbi:MAG: hypothetical protein SGILL_005885 [Bacillariaceae sp.]
MGDLKKKKKPRVEEFNGVLWQLDDNGNRIKKVKRKDKNSRSKSPTRPKRKRTIKEIDGVLYMLDETGIPIKRVRRKGDVQQRSMSQAPGNREPMTRQAFLRSQSVGAPLRRKPGEYVDSKGRRVIVHEDGTKTVFDKNGKKLRPKQKIPKGNVNGAKSERLARAQSPPKSPRTRARSERLMNGKRKSPSPRRRPENNVQAPMVHLSPDVNKHEVGLRLSEIDRENLELKMQLMQAKDQAEDLDHKTQKDKAKNVRALAEADQLQKKHVQAEEQNRHLRLKVKNLEARLDQMDQKIESVQSMPVLEETPVEETEDHLKSQLTKLKEQNLSLLNKLDSQKTRSSSEMKVRDEQINQLNEMLMKIRQQNDQIFSGDADPDVLKSNLLRDKKSLEQEMASARKETNDQLRELQIQMDEISNVNTDLKNQVKNATLEINDEDDEEMRRAKEMAQAVAQHGIKNAARAKRASVRINSGMNDSQQNGSGFGFKLSALANASISGLSPG